MFSDSLVAELIKLVAFCTGVMLAGYLLSRRSNRNKIRTYRLDTLKISGGIVANNVTITTPIGNHTAFMIVDITNERVDVTTDAVEASRSVYNDKVPFVLKSYRTKESCVVMISSAICVNNPYNFLTGEFKHALTNENSYVHVLE